MRAIVASALCLIMLGACLMDFEQYRHAGDAAAGGATSTSASGGGGATSSGPTTGAGGAPIVSQWSHSYGDAEDEQLLAMDVDAAGNIYIGGLFNGGIDFGTGALQVTGSADAFLAKLDPDGNTLWSQSFGDAGTQRISALVVDGAGQIYVAGFFDSEIDLGGGALVSTSGLDAFVAKLDTNGQHLWSDFYGGVMRQSANAVALSADESLLAVVGDFDNDIDIGGTVHTSAGLDDGFVATLNVSTGAVLNSVRFGDPFGNKADEVAFGPAGEIAVGGSFASLLEFGSMLFQPASTGDGDLYVAKLSTGLVYEWGRSFEADNGFSEVDGLAFDAQGNVLLTGRFQVGGNLAKSMNLTSAGSYDVLVARFDTSGTLLGQAQYGNTGNERCFDLVLNDDGNVLLTGFFGGSAGIDFGAGPITGDGPVDVFVAELTPDLDHVYSRGFAGPMEQRGLQIAPTPDGGIVFSGYFEGTVPFDDQTLQSQGMNDVFVAKLSR